MTLTNLADGVTVTTGPALPRPDDKGVVRAEAVIEWVQANYTPSIDQHGNAVLLDERTRRAVPMESAGPELKATMWLEGSLTLTDAVERQAFGVVSALARRGERCRTALRSARGDGRLWLDIGDAVYTVTADGWAQESTPDKSRPYFLPSDPLPAPKPGGSASDFAGVLGLPAGSKAARLMWLWTVGAVALQTEPTPILWLVGEPNSAKTLRGVLAASVVQPIEQAREFPKVFKDDLKMLMSKSAAVVLDDAPAIRVDAELSKSLTRLVTGMQVSRRVLYTNADVITFTVSTPTVVTSVYLPPGLQQDNLSRTLPVHLPRAQGRTTEEVRDDFGRAHGKLLGAALDTLAATYRTEVTRPAVLNRLGAFHMLARRMQAAEGQPYEDDFLGAVSDAQIEAAWEEPIVQALIAYMDARDGRQVALTPAEWLEELSRVRVQEGIVMTSKAWPDSPDGVGQRFTMRADVLERLGIKLERTRRSRQTSTGAWAVTRTWVASGRV